MGQQSDKVVSVDCSEVLNDAAQINSDNPDNTGIGIHTSYFSVDQVQADIAAVLLGKTAKSIPNRSSLANSGAYKMTLAGA